MKYGTDSSIVPSAVSILLVFRYILSLFDFYGRLYISRYLHFARDVKSVS